MNGKSLAKTGVPLEFAASCGLFFVGTAVVAARALLVSQPMPWPVAFVVMLIVAHSVHVSLLAQLIVDVMG